MTEQLLSEEVETRPLTPTDQLIELCQKSEVPLGLGYLRYLIPAIEIRDLATDVAGNRSRREYKVEPLAVLDKQGLLLDSRFEKLQPEQQRYVLGHELGHYLSAYLRQTQVDKWQDLMNLVNKLPNHETSYYVHYLAEQFPDPADQPKIAEEKLAEVISQFLSGSGTFTGLLGAKLLTLPDLPESMAAQYQDQVETAETLANQLSQLDGDNKATDIWTDHPGLERHYQLYQQLRTLLTDGSTYQPLEEKIRSTEEYQSYYDNDTDLFEYDEMIDYIPSILPDQSPAWPQLSQVKTTTSPSSGWFNNLFKFLDLFSPLEGTAK